MFDSVCDYRTGRDELDPAGKFSYKQLNATLRTTKDLVVLEYCGYQAMLGRKIGKRASAGDVFIHILRMEDPNSEVTTLLPRELKIHISL